MVSYYEQQDEQQHEQHGEQHGEDTASYMGDDDDDEDELACQPRLADEDLCSDESSSSPPRVDDNDVPPLYSESNMIRRDDGSGGDEQEEDDDGENGDDFVVPPKRRQSWPTKQQQQNKKPKKEEKKTVVELRLKLLKTENGYLTMGTSKKTLSGLLEGSGPFTLGELSAGLAKDLDHDLDLSKFAVMGRGLKEQKLNSTGVLELIGSDTSTVSSQEFPTGPRVVISVAEADAQRVFKAAARDAAAPSLSKRSTETQPKKKKQQKKKKEAPETIDLVNDDSEDEQLLEQEEAEESARQAKLGNLLPPPKTTRRQATTARQEEPDNQRPRLELAAQLTGRLNPVLMLKCGGALQRHDALVVADLIMKGSAPPVLLVGGGLVVRYQGGLIIDEPALKNRKNLDALAAVDWSEILPQGLRSASNAAGRGASDQFMTGLAATMTAQTKPLVDALSQLVSARPAAAPARTPPPPLRQVFRDTSNIGTGRLSTQKGNGSTLKVLSRTLIRLLAKSTEIKDGPKVAGRITAALANENVDQKLIQVFKDLHDDPPPTDTDARDELYNAFKAMYPEE